MEKHLSYNFHLWKNVYHRDFIQFSVRMELYDKKFLIYGNSMIRSFGHPGKWQLNHFEVETLKAIMPLSEKIKKNELSSQIR